MLSDIEIAQQAKMLKINRIAENLGISEEDIEPYGHYKAKLSESLFIKTADSPDGRLIPPLPLERERLRFRWVLRRLWQR